MIDSEHVKRISPEFWGAIAGAVAAGAILFPSSRVIGGAIGGAAMFVVALKLTPCCDGCAKGQGCGARESIALEVTPPAVQLAPVDVARLFRDAETRRGCA
jgi:hypothetical protein